MASAADDSDLPPIPSLPPLVGIDGRRYEDVVPKLFPGQNSPPAAVGLSKNTPPLFRINAARSDQPSAMSSLTATYDVSTPAASRTRGRDNSGSSDEDEPSPKKTLPDFNLRKSEEDSVASGDDSDGWNREDGRVMHELAAQAEEDDARDNAVFPDVQMNEVNEWEVLAEEGIADEGNVDCPSFETIRIVYQKTTAKGLSEIATKVGVSPYGTKRKLFDRIRDSGKVVKVDDDSFDYRRQIVAGEKIPTWVILNPEPAVAVPGVDMATGAAFGFYGPTNKENAVGGERNNFAMNEADRIQCPEFEQEKRERGRTYAPNTDGGPSPAARKRIPKMKVARPKDFFDLQITPEFVQWMTNATNRRAISDGAGSGTGQFQDWVPFDDAEMYRFIGVLFANGLSPKPRIDYWFETAQAYPLFGNDLVSRLMTKEVVVTGKRIRGIRRWRHFRRFFTVADYRENPKEKQKTDPLWKVRMLIDELNKQSKDMWIPGKWVAIDEQTIGFQGASSMKLRISYKREGDGFQCNAVCDRGYTYSFWFRHGPPPTLGPDFKTWSFHQQLAKLSGLLNVCRINSRESTWTTCSIP